MGLVLKKLGHFDFDGFGKMHILRSLGRVILLIVKEFQWIFKDVNFGGLDGLVLLIYFIC